MPAPIDEDRILDAALDVWREHGFRNATTRKVAALAGIAEVTLFRRFGDKSALFAAALQREADMFRADIEFSNDIMEDLTALVAAYQTMLARNGAIVLDFLVEAPHNPEMAEIGPVPMTAIAGAAALIAKYQELGGIKAQPPHLVVLALLGPLIMAHAVSRAQPMLAFQFDPRVVASRFLDGWQGV